MSEIKESTTESPFEFFNQILFYNGINLIEESFYNPNQYTEGYKFHNEIGKFTGWIKMLPDTVELLNEISYFKKVLKYNANKSLALLSNKTDELDTHFKKDFLSNQLNEIYSFLSKISKSIDLKYSAVIEEELINIANDIFYKYSFLQLRHKLFYKINAPKNLISSFFQCKEYPVEFYSKLYDLTSNLQLIDETETFEDDFINTLISSNPAKEKFNIKFTKNNYLVSYYLRKIEPFFEGLNFTSIEKSGSFYNKQNKLFTASDLSTSFSRGKNKCLSEKTFIKQSLLKFSQQY